MTETSLSLFDAARSGVYRTPPAPDSLRTAVLRAGLEWFSVDLAEVRDKARFLGACAADLEFPGSFGHNWDALADSLQDFSWRAAPGYLILLRHAATFAGSAPEDYALAIDILRETAAFWKERRTAFIALVDDAADLPVFGA